MIGDIVFNVFFIILGSLEEASLGVFAFIVLWLVEKGVEHSPNLRCSIPRPFSTTCLSETDFLSCHVDYTVDFISICVEATSFCYVAVKNRSEITVGV